MKVCFPVAADRGVESEIYGHFSSAPHFLVVDSETQTSNTVANCDPRNPYAGCNPFLALSHLQLDAIIAGGIGDDALRTMNMCGFRVLEAQSANLAENLELFKRKELPEAVVQFSDLAGRCSDSVGTCNHTHDHDHEEDGPEVQEQAACDPATCNPENCSLGHCN